MNIMDFCGMSGHFDGILWIYEILRDPDEILFVLMEFYGISVKTSRILVEYRGGLM